LKFIHLKGQIAVQAVEDKVRRLVEEFKRFCSFADGRPEVRETSYSYIMTCYLGSKKNVSADIWSEEDRMLLTVGTHSWEIKDLPKSKRFSFGKISFVPKESIETTVTGELSPTKNAVHGTAIVDRFSIVLDKEYKDIYVFVPRI